MTTRERIRTYLAQHPYQTGREIAQALDVSKSTLHRYLREFDEKGILGRQPHYVQKFGYTIEYYLRDIYTP